MKGEDSCINISETNFRKAIFWHIIDHREIFNNSSIQLLF